MFDCQEIYHHGKVIFENTAGIVRAFLLLVSGVLSSEALPAQTLFIDYWAYGEDGQASGRTDSGFVSVEGKTLTWVWNTATEVGTAPLYQLPMDLPKSVQNLYNRTILLSGWDIATAKGYLVHLGMDPATRQVVELSRTQFAAVDPIDLAYNKFEDRLYIWNGQGPDLRSAVWSGGPLPPEAQYQVIFTSADLPALSDPIGHNIVANVYEPGIDLGPTPDNPKGMNAMGTADCPRVRIHLVGSSWQHYDYSLYDPDAMEDAGYKVLDRGELSTNESLRIKGPGGPFDVLDVTNAEALVFQGSLPQNPDWFRDDDDDLATWHEVAFGELQLIPGHEYKITDTSQSFESMPLFPLVRYGKPESTMVGGSLFSLATGDINSWNFTVGSDEAVQALIYTDKHPPGPQSFSSYLWWALRDPSGADPVMFLGGDSWLLTPDGSLGPFEHTLNEPHNFGQPVVMFDSPFAGFPIPSDGSLAGNVVLFQWIVVFSPGGETLLSDVFGSTILPGSAPGGNLAAMTSGLAPGGSMSLGPLRPCQTSYLHARQLLSSTRMQDGPVPAKSSRRLLRAAIVKTRK